MALVSKPLKRDDLMRLYESGKSMAEMATIFDCSVNKIVYWMTKHGISRRNHRDSSYLKHNPGGDPFKIKKDLSKEDMFLYGLGVGIYWGEGNKSLSVSSLRVANTDPALLRTFVSFLKEIYGLDSKRLSYGIVCFNDVDPDTARAYWSDELKILPERFGKITIIPRQGKGTYKRKSQFGVCTVQGNNVKLRRLLFEELEKIKARKSA